MANHRLKFIELADALIAKLTPLTSNEADWQGHQAKSAVENIRTLREQAAQGILPRSNGAGLGITRALGEWAPDDVYQAGCALEQHYVENM